MLIKQVGHDITNACRIISSKYAESMKNSNEEEEESLKKRSAVISTNL
jgi:hypothetical protein